MSVKVVRYGQRTKEALEDIKKMKKKIDFCNCGDGNCPQNIYARQKEFYNEAIDVVLARFGAKGVAK
jgi:hypothetical protein